MGAAPAIPAAFLSAFRSWAAVAIAAMLAVSLSACNAAPAADPGEEGQDPAIRQIGLMTTLPILWAESDDFSQMLAPDAPSHWARAVLAGEGSLMAVDTLGPGQLAGIDLLVLAQPRMLSAAENVALDDWVRGGGKALIFADPLLTEHSRYSIGDRRRPQDVALLDTILARWGLRLEQAVPAASTKSLSWNGQTIPLAAHGAFRREETRFARCSDLAGPVLVSCDIGEGTALILADAALLEEHQEDDPAAQRALAALIRQAAGPIGDAAGNIGE